MSGLGAHNIEMTDGVNSISILGLTIDFGRIQLVLREKVLI